MSIRIGIYDFFAYTVPGGLMLLALLAAMDAAGVQGLWGIVVGMNTLQVFVAIVSCYLAGFVCSPFLSRWSAVFEPREFEKDALDRFRAKHPGLAISIEASDWAIWLASIRRENLDLSVEIDRHMAVSKMIRGISLFLLLSGFIAVVNIFTGRISAWYILAVAVAIGLAVLTVRESIKFKRWFYFVIFELVAARQEQFSTPATPEKSSSTKSKSK